MWSDTLDTCVKHEISCDFYFLLCNSIFFFCVVFVEDSMVLRCPKVGPGVRRAFLVVSYGFWMALYPEFSHCMRLREKKTSTLHPPAAEPGPNTYRQPVCHLNQKLFKKQKEISNEQKTLTFFF